MRKSRNHDAAFKARVVLEAVNGERTVSESAADLRGASDDDSSVEEGFARKRSRQLRARREVAG